MKAWIMLIGLTTLLILSACAPSQGATVVEDAAAGAGDSLANPLELVAGGDLSPQGQLALGTLQLEDTDQAVEEAQAATLLPLWQALQALNDSDTTAQVELDAVVRQIQQAMTPEQLETIAAMELTAESLTALIESGELGFFGPGAGGSARASGEDEGGFAGGPGGGGFIIGGPPPGGDPGGFGGPGPGAGLTEDQLATRRAELADADPAEMQNRMLTGMVVRLLQTKTGQAPAGPPGDGFEAMMAVITEATGLSAEEIRAQTAEGKALAEVVEAGGGDVTAVRAGLIEALSALPDTAEMDVEQMADRWLGLQNP